MRFEKFLLDDYLQTKEGKKVFDFFTNFKNIFYHHFGQFSDFVNSFLGTEVDSYYCYDDEWNFENFISGQPQKLKNFDDFVELYIPHKKFEEDPLSYQEVIIYYSVFFFIKEPEYAFPYLYPLHFYRFQEICRIFDIFIPELPGKTKHLERVKFYFGLCRSMYEFRKEHGLSPVELCVFLYGFAPRFFTSYIANELPEANNIHIVGAAREDAENFENDPPDKDTSSIWQGTDAIQVGDIVIMYERSPYSRFSYIWRAVSPGYDDPFSGYSGKVVLGYPIRIPCISFNTLITDPVWGKNSLVKAHMQGIGFKQTLITQAEYAQLKKLITQADSSFDLSKLPEPPPYANFYHEGIETEKDVEEQLLEPFLTKLGFDVKKEFTRQFPIRMGRGFRYYPDYALHATGSRGGERADFIWEAKYRIPTARQLREDYGQAISYAVRLQTKGFGLVSLEGVKIWMADERGHFDFEKGIRYSWEELETPEKLGKVRLLFKGYSRAGKSR